MLNEFISLERGLADAGIATVPRHADVLSPGKIDAIHVRLGENGHPVGTAPLDKEKLSGLWTLRKGNHNSFPYLQFNRPLLPVPASGEWRERAEAAWQNASSLSDRADQIKNVFSVFAFDREQWAAWPGTGFRTALSERTKALTAIEPAAAAVPALFSRFLSATQDGAGFVVRLVEAFVEAADDADDKLLTLIWQGLVGRRVQGNVRGAPVYFDVSKKEAFPRAVADARNGGSVSQALSMSDAAISARNGVCDFTGLVTSLHKGNFPKPKLKVIGEIYLFSKNGDIPAAYRYGMADDDAVSIDASLAQRIAGALDEITADYRHGKTWRSIPSERPKKPDLLIAYVEGAFDVPLAGFIARSEEEAAVDTNNYHDDEHEEEILPASKFEDRTAHLISTIKGHKIAEDYRDLPVVALVLRKVDPGNTKAILYRRTTVGNLMDAAVEWAAGLDNTPDWLRLPAPVKGVGTPRIRPFAFSPLQLPSMTRALFIRDGERAEREPVGLTAHDALSLFLDSGQSARIARWTLPMVLARQSMVVTTTAQATRSGEISDVARGSREALRACAIIGLLLWKLGRRKEDYMVSAAFRLGQLLAIADDVHAGYCADIRGNRYPPVLLGNSLLATALAQPVRALAVFALRWPVYGAWAKNPNTWARRKKNQRISIGIYRALAATKICSELETSLRESRVDDAFRAELVLGYIAGVPKKEGASSPGGDDASELNGVDMT